MPEKPQTILEQILAKGYSRRDFLRFCSYITAAAGIHASGLSRVVHALETKARPPVIWFHFQECTCCSESFIRSSHPI
ncbi:MAG: twin-arginine translocation signal domain-containing protein, partial [Calditrichia bacterium]|nr:twin-arginine translocation signal domain-containing protein [Calditrichia bacterium]